MEHDVRVDTAGELGLIRVTCHSEGCNQATLQRGNMTDQEWKTAIENYRKQHPFPKKYG